MSEAMVSAVREAASYIERRAEAEADGPVSLKELGDHVQVSPWHLQRQFKKVLGVSPREYDDALRMKRLRKGLKSGVGVAGATFEAGYGSSSRVYERASAALGMTPANYAKNGRGQRIRYGVAPCLLGLVLVAATERGICRVQLGASEPTMVHLLKTEFSAAEIARDESALKPYLAEILHRLEGEAPHADLPLDIRATAFQRRVWEELRRIPVGETRSYAEVARAIGKPAAVRAVGNACANNPVAIAIPCHRVLRNDGNLGGYAWGIKRKQALIAAEKAHSATPETRARKKA